MFKPNPSHTMKHLALTFCLLLGGTAGGSLSAQDVVTLPKPRMERPATLMQALSSRQSTRVFATSPLSEADLADLLWAANGVNRPADGGRTAPSALNRQDVDVYVLRADGAFRYDATRHALARVATADLRPAAAGGQDFVATAPVVIVLVSDLSKFGGPADEGARRMGALDAGIVAQNVALFCAAARLATVPRASMDTAALRAGLGLTDAQEPMLNLPVGHFAR